MIYAGDLGFLQKLIPADTEPCSCRQCGAKKTIADMALSGWRIDKQWVGICGSCLGKDTNFTNFHESPVVVKRATASSPG